jgi:hypothetical protein
MSNSPIFRISLANATILSGVYLIGGAVVEVVRRAWNPRWAERLSHAFEDFPARMLHALGLFEPLRRAWIEGHLSEFQVRLVYGATMVLLFFSLSLAVGGAMWLFSRLFSRSDASDESR